jgi:hypothetical protein
MGPLLPPQSFAGLYNIPSPWTPGNAAVDVLHASRTLLWLKSEEALVMYDRATTLHSGKFKRFNMNFIAAPTIAGNTVTAIGKTNRAQVTSLLPANATITAQVRTSAYSWQGYSCFHQNMRLTSPNHLAAVHRVRLRASYYAMMALQRQGLCAVLFASSHSQ